MSNGYKIEWSELAVNDFNKTIQYLSENWSENEIHSFVRTIDGQIRVICLNPTLYPSTSFHPGLRRCVASKFHTLYYYVRKETIYIVTIWDNRRNPRKLQDILK